MVESRPTDAGRGSPKCVCSAEITDVHVGVSSTDKRTELQRASAWSQLFTSEIHVPHGVFVFNNLITQESLDLVLILLFL